ncbi:MAG: DUF87 domain-containing protein [Flavobacteriales bacterium]|nr:DUF87 domain-containing protein [Flavobacteriales bacterium]
MKITHRVFLLVLSLALLLLIGWLREGSFTFALTDFWFVAGALMLVLVSLVDQPNFSKDANIFANGTAALVSLYSIQAADRGDFWVMFMVWSSYLILSSTILMVRRSRPLHQEGRITQLVSRINRAIGRPESIFSALFLWGIAIQFSYPNDRGTINSLLVFWGLFMIVNVPSIAQTLSDLVTGKDKADGKPGVVIGIQSPRVAIVRLSPGLAADMVGQRFSIKVSSGEVVAEGTLIEDRILQGFRQGRLAIHTFGTGWKKVSAETRVSLVPIEAKPSDARALSTVADGSSIATLQFNIDPRSPLHTGQVVHVSNAGTTTYYQVVGATVVSHQLADGNESQSVRVQAGQLGKWISERASFEPLDWVASAGEIVTLSGKEAGQSTIPEGKTQLGHVPESTFPVHLDVQDAVTHNTAILGITGSGKTYLAIHLIEAYLAQGVRVLILDITRQHYSFLAKNHSPTKIRDLEGLKAWLSGGTPLGIFQFVGADDRMPQTTASFVKECFDWGQKDVKLRAGVNLPARLCIVMEEAHSLVPEWNQAVSKGDQEEVNRTAKYILQGRKFGLGVLLISQRTANVTKTILNQCNTLFALRSYDQTGLDFLKNYMGDDHVKTISTLPQFTTVLVGKASSSLRPIILKVNNFADRWKDTNDNDDNEIIP